MRQTQKLLAILLAVLAMFAGGVPTMNVGTPQTPIVAGLAIVDKKSAPTLKHRDKEPEAIVGSVDAGGGPEVQYTITSSEQRPVELKAHVVTEDQGGTPTQVTYQGKHVTFRSDEEGGGAPVGTVTVAAVFSVDTSIYASQTPQTRDQNKGDGFRSDKVADPQPYHR